MKLFKLFARKRNASFSTLGSVQFKPRLHLPIRAASAQPLSMSIIGCRSTGTESLSRFYLARLKTRSEKNGVFGI